MKKLFMVAVFLLGAVGAVSAQEADVLTKEDIAALESVGSDSDRAVLSDSERIAKIDKMVAKALKSERVVNAAKKAVENPEIRGIVQYNLNSPQVKKMLNGTQVSKELYNEKGEVKVDNNSSKGWIIATVVLGVIAIILLVVLVKVLAAIAAAFINI